MTPPGAARAVVESAVPAKPEPKAAKQASKFDDHWGRFTVTDAQRYYQSLQIQCNIHSATSTKRRFRLKTASSLLVAGAPASTGDAMALLRSEQVKRARLLHDHREKHLPGSSGRETFLLGSLDALLAQPPESSLSTTAILSACLFRLRPPPLQMNRSSAHVGENTREDEAQQGEDDEAFVNEDQTMDTTVTTHSKSLLLPERYVSS
jgi:hypothetical protein